MSLSGWVELRYCTTMKFYPQIASVMDCVYKYSLYMVIFMDSGKEVEIVVMTGRETQREDPPFSTTPWYGVPFVG